MRYEFKVDGAVLIDGLREETCNIINSSSGFHFSRKKYMKTALASKREKTLNCPRVDPLLADCESLHVQWTVFTIAAMMVFILLGNLSNDDSARKQRRLVEGEFIFYKLNSRLSRSVHCANGSKKELKLNMQRRRSIPNGSISRRGPRSENDAELGHFTLLFCRGRGKEM